MATGRLRDVLLDTGAYAARHRAPLDNPKLSIPGVARLADLVYPKAHIDDNGSLGIKHISFKRPELAGIDLDDFGPDPYYIEYVTARLCERAAEIVREAGGHFFVTVLRFAMSDNLREQLEARGIPVVDASVNGREYSLMPFDGHPNAKANEIFAERIYAYIADHGGLEASAAHPALQARSA